MLKKLVFFFTALAIVFIPLGAVQARLSSSTFDKQEIVNLMDQMMVGELDADSQIMLSGILGDKMKDGKFQKRSYGDMRYDKSTNAYYVIKLVHLVFFILVLSLLFLLNCFLYKKITVMDVILKAKKTGKKKK